MKTRLAKLALVAVCATLGQASADEVDRSLGAQSCMTIVAASPADMKAYGHFIAWYLGYVSVLLSPERQSKLFSAPGASLVAGVVDFCKAHPDNFIYAAVVTVAVNATK